MEKELTEKTKKDIDKARKEKDIPLSKILKNGYNCKSK